MLSFAFVFVIWYFKEGNLNKIKFAKAESCEIFGINISEWTLRSIAKSPPKI